MDNEEKEIETVDYDEEALQLEEKLRTAIQGGAKAMDGDGGGSW